ncbi:MAG: 16S rRNA (cytosine(1402)-N(4))-methyltransferase RsmH [Clostridia bacterium]
MEIQEQEHKRRVRYSGTHPKKFEDKYKELQPEKYAETVEKIKQKGKTPAGMHISICVNEILEFLQIKQGQIGVDATLGYGGHTLEMLKRLDGNGHVYGLDLDPIEIVKTQKRLADQGFGEELFTAVHTNFADIEKISEKLGKFDFILADLGVSSMQIDNPMRGFSYKKDGPLDLRLDPEKGVSGAELLKTLTQSELQEMLVDNADEPYAPQIAKAIVARFKRGGEILTTTDLRKTIADALEFLPINDRKDLTNKSCQRTFQALRIDVNHEFESLKLFLDALPKVLKSGGRVAILSFHSGEDRLVKKSFKFYFKNGVYSDVAKELIRPSIEECRLNTRAHSAKMRWAINF